MPPLYYQNLGTYSFSNKPPKFATPCPRNSRYVLLICTWLELLLTTTTFCECCKCQSHSMQKWSLWDLIWNLIFIFFGGAGESRKNEDMYDPSSSSFCCLHNSIIGLGGSYVHTYVYENARVQNFFINFALSYVFLPNIFMLPKRCVL